MKRIFFLGMLSIFTAVVKGQTIAFVSDTAVVGMNIHGEDTSYYIKAKPQKGEWAVYYDKSRSQLALKTTYPWEGARPDRQSWYRNGQKKDSTVNHDYPFDRFETKYWYPDGRLKGVRICGLDSCISQTFYPNGQLERKDVSTVDSSRQDEMVIRYSVNYYDNGQRESSPIFYGNDTMLTIYRYYPSGVKKMQCDWLKGSAAGPWTEWYENGQVKVSGQYEIDPARKVVVGPKRTGHWIYYNAGGWIEREEWYDENGLTKFKTFDKNGKVTGEG